MTVIKEVKVGEVSGAALDYLVLTCGELDADSNITTKQDTHHTASIIILK